MMSRIVLAFALLFSVAGLSACGFTPMHAPTAFSGGTTPLKNITVNLIEPEEITDDQGAFWVQQALYDRLGTQGGSHILNIEPTFRRQRLGLTAEDVATRFDMTANVDYELVDSVTGDILDSGSISATSSYGSARDPYATVESDRSTTQNVARLAADRVIARVATYYANQGQ